MSDNHQIPSPADLAARHEPIGAEELHDYLRMTLKEVAEQLYSSSVPLLLGGTLSFSPMDEFGRARLLWAAAISMVAIELQQQGYSVLQVNGRVLDISISPEQRTPTKVRD